MFLSSENISSGAETSFNVCIRLVNMVAHNPDKTVTCLKLQIYDLSIITLN